MATFNTTIQISQADVQYLKENGYSLYGFKAVGGSGAGQPTVWFKLEQDVLLANTQITWEEKFEGYNSNNQVLDSVQITSSTTIKTNLGNIVTINAFGGLSNEVGGQPTAITFSNRAQKKYTVGISQTVNSGQSSILCAFPLTGNGSARIIKPLTKIVLIFSTDAINTATVITKAMSSGAFIDLTDDNSRTVKYSTDTGWSADKNSGWMQNFDAMTNMADLLIESQSDAEKALAEKYKEEVEA